MRGNGVSIILAFVCIGFIVGSVLSFTIPYQREQMILWGSNFGILDHLTDSSHVEFPFRSYNQSIDIFLQCTNGSLDIVILKSTEWDAWNNGENYSAYYEMKNVTSVMTTVEINPPYIHLIDIIMQTNYGDVEMSVDISIHWIDYNDLTGVNSLLAAIPFALCSIYYAKKKPTNDANSNGLDIS
jgi:hypothetical protein